MLYLIGLGLGDAKDVTVRGLEVIRKCSRVYLEAYTSILTVGKDALEEFYGRPLILADRETVEQEAGEILRDAAVIDVAFLVVGDPFGATTHSDLVLRAAKAGIPHRVIHNASILSAVGCCGLQGCFPPLCNTPFWRADARSSWLYNFGETVSIVFWTDTWKPESFYDKIRRNRLNGMHTLCLLDIKVKEQSIENLMKGRKVYEPPRYMTVSQAAKQLVEIVQNRRALGEELAHCRPGGAHRQPGRRACSADSGAAAFEALTENTICVGLARVGASDQQIASGTLQQLCSVDMGGPLHSLVISGCMHPLELDMLRLFAVDPSSFEQINMEDSSTYLS
ncbi:diphthine methyl ester synthase isoform X1 [Ascaphus truei]|uniref:diphthine methyl ester synthase isoform X1 n=1 Tax=Ascaphus truei TaxID=8439 RepID=UPI003F59A3DD